MLPDFATMARIRLPEVAPGALADGIAYHHETDRVFHRLERFRKQESWTLGHMLSSGLRRGPARGVAHVGVELSLDGALVSSTDAHDTYLNAIGMAQQSRLAWKSQESEARFAMLITRLLEIGVPSDYRDPRIVADRLVRIMKPRPLLRLTEEETPILHDAMPAVHKRVDDEADAIMRDMQAALSEG